MDLQVAPAVAAPLDAGFVAAALWNRAYRQRVEASGGEPLAFALERPNGNVSVFRTRILTQTPENRDLNRRYAERLLKFLLWQKGGNRVTVAGNGEVACWLAGVYGPEGARAFDYQFMGERVYRAPFEIAWAPYEK